MSRFCDGAPALPDIGGVTVLPGDTGPFGPTGALCAVVAIIAPV
ncbi:hypothetical protein LT85_1017 [Collimonas arenae]|uniref:Uncharacterized protein n=1 Tax=Collimonas arenae TaxID=279058 RepID=A0A0A1F8T2_9BURK|nr:hypothetical protein LT85_1017 [Collimonas arenae]